jgi:PhnB protein
MVKPIPDGFTSITPYLIVRDVAGAIDFYERAFDASVIQHERNHNHELHGAQVRIGTGAIMLGQSANGPTYEPSQPIPQATVFLFVPDVDAVMAKAVAEGATSIMPVEDKYYGERMGGVVDPFGIVWWISTHIEDVPPEELPQRAAAARAAKEQK